MIAVKQPIPSFDVHCNEHSDARKREETEYQIVQDVRDDHVRLRSLLALVADQLLADDQDVGYVALAGTFDQLRDQLALHFTLQMSFGYLNDTLEIAPRLSGQAEELQREQFLLFLEMCEIADEAQELLYSKHHVRGSQFQMLKQRFEEFSLNLTRHDVRERELIYQAFCDDIGVGD